MQPTDADCMGLSEDEKRADELAAQLARVTEERDQALAAVNARWVAFEEAMALTERLERQCHVACGWALDLGMAIGFPLFPSMTCAGAVTDSAADPLMAALDAVARDHGVEFVACVTSAVPRNPDGSENRAYFINGGTATPSSDVAAEMITAGEYLVEAGWAVGRAAAERSR